MDDILANDISGDDAPEGRFVEGNGDTLGRFLPIDHADCLHLVRDRQVGRLGFVHDGQPLILPVAYVFDGRLVTIATQPGTVLAGLADPGIRVALEVDEVDPETATGWSVLATGLTETPPDEPAEWPQPWAPGVRSLLLGVRVERVSGRIVSRPR